MDTVVCANTQTTGGTPPYTYSWDFGDGTPPQTGPSPCHTYAVTGKFSITVTVTDSTGVSVTDNHLTASITPALAVNSSVSRESGYAPATFFFTAMVTGGTGPYGYKWDFGDGTTSTVGNPSHTYTNPGYYTTSITVTDNCAPFATAIDSHLKVAVYPVVVTTSVNQPCGYAPLNVIFVETANGGVPPYTHAWDFGDGTPGSSLQNPSHSYLAVGTYTAKVTTTDALGVSGTSSVTVSVTPVLAVSVLGLPTTSGPSPLTIDVSSTVTGGTPPYTYDWDFGEGSQHSTSPADQHTWLAPGPFDVVLTVKDSCGHTSAQHLTVNPYGPVTPTVTPTETC